MSGSYDRGAGGFRGGYGQQSGYGAQGSYGGYGSEATYGNQGWSHAGGAYGQGSQQRGQQRGPKGYTRSDERLKEDICERLMQSGHIDASEVTVQVQSGKVILEGTVPERHMKHAIEDLADNCMGVKDVENRIRVSRGEPSSSQEQEDASRTAGTYGVSSNASNRSKKE